MTRHEFSSSYTVVEPSATISATLMNVLYAGIGNPISISVPGIPNHAIQATMTNGTLTRQGDNWIAKPAKVGQDAVITVTATMDGRAQTVANTQFRVRQLPDPMPFIAYKDANGYEQKYKGETFPQNTTAFCARYSSRNRRRPVERHLSGTAIRNGLFSTLWEMRFPKFPTEPISLNDRKIRSADYREENGSISRVRAVGPDGIERDLSPIEVIVN